MTRRFQIIASLIILVIIIWLGACSGTPEPPQVSAISVNPGTDIMIGESASLTVKASGQDLQFNWSVARGKLSSETAPSVIYEAPDSPGPDTVTVNVVGSGGATTIQSITFQVVAPTPTPTPSSTPSPIPTYTPMPPTDTPVLPTNIPSTPTVTPTLTPASTAMPTVFIIDHMDSTLDWEQYRDDKGSSIVLRSTSGMFDNAVEISFDLKQDGYVGIAKEFYPGILSGTEGIEFSYNGSGAPNTIELKLLYAPDSDGKSAVFSASWHHITATNEWKTFEVPYTQFGCWVDTGCVLDEEIDLERIWKVDFAISNKLGDTPGIGVVAIDNVQGINLR